MNIIHKIASALVWVGALNWGLVGVSSFFGQNWNLVTLLLGGMPSIENIVYVLVGISAVYVVATHKGSCKDCCSADDADGQTVA
jgi:uncharacterized membrane protein YuzA (DUF378 family)